MHQISFGFFQRGITPEREITRTRNKMCVKYFSMRNPYMKFQNPSMHGSWTNGRTHAHTDGRAHNPKPICPVNFFEVGGITTTIPIPQTSLYILRWNVKWKLTIFIKQSEDNIYNMVCQIYMSNCLCHMLQSFWKQNSTWKQNSYSKFTKILTNVFATVTFI